MKTVSIIGVGLMGGSLGLALKQHQYRVIGIGRNIKKLQLAKQKGAIDCFYTDIKNVVNSDIVVIALPVDKIVETYKKLSKIVSNKTIICDIGSVKYNIVKQINIIRTKNKKLPYFVGCHPMTGIEKNGIENADKNLYHCKVVIITNKQNKMILPVIKMWKDIGCKILYIQPKQHDEIVAFTSHLPHIIAFSFYKMFKEKSNKNLQIKDIVAGSFNSITRVAKSSSDIWSPIITENRHNLKKLLKEFCNQLQIFGKCFDDEKSLEKLLDKSINNDNK